MPRFQPPPDAVEELEELLRAEAEPEEGEGETPDEEHNRAVSVKERHEQELLRIPGVEGVGVTQNELGEAAIAVYVRDRGVAKQLPSELDGIGLVIEVSGPIDAL